MHFQKYSKNRVNSSVTKMIYIICRCYTTLMVFFACISLFRRIGYDPVGVVIKNIYFFKCHNFFFLQ